jgi:hypothetical protein
VEDAQGLPLECRTPEAAAALESAIDDLLGWRSGARAAVERALKLDRRSRLGQAVRAYELLCHPHPDGPGALRQALARGAEAPDGPRGSAHLDAARHWTAGQPAAAAAALERWLLEAPQDLLALGMVQRLYLAGGDATNLRDAPARLFAAWDTETPGYASLLACYAWGLAEAGAAAEAEALAVEALQRDPGEATAALAVALALEQGSRGEEADTWFALQAGAWRQADRLAPRLAWYRALMQLDRGGVSGALRSYDRALAPLLQEPRQLTEATALLWRLELVGGDVGPRWQAVLEGFRLWPAETLEPQDVLARLMAAAGGGGAELEAARAVLESACEGDGHAARALRALGRPLAEGLVAFAQHRAASAVAALQPIRGHLAQLGGGRALRDTFEQTLIHAALLAEEHRLARALLSERRAHRPNSPQTWQATAANFEALGETAAAETALARVRGLLAA